MVLWSRGSKDLPVTFDGEKDVVELTVWATENSNYERTLNDAKSELWREYHYEAGAWGAQENVCL